MFIKDTQVLGIVLEQLFKKKIIYMLNIYNILPSPRSQIQKLKK